MGWRLTYSKRKNKFQIRNFWKAKRELWDRANYMKDNPTKAEDRMWKIIQKKVNSVLPEGCFFRRQRAPFPDLDCFYIIDFYCEKLCLGIEVDGSIHDGREKLDRAREHQLKQRGIKLVHVSNETVLCDPVRMEAFVTMVLNVCQGLLKH